MLQRRMGYGRRKRLGDLLVEAGAITPEQIEQALAKQKEDKRGLKLGAILVDLDFVTEQQIVDALRDQLGYPDVVLAKERIADDVLRLMDESLLRKYSLMPFGFNEKNPNILKVAMSDPLDIRAIDDISIITGLQVEVFVTTLKDVSSAIDRYYGNAAAMKVAEQFTKEREELNRDRQAADEAEDEALSQAPIVKLVKQTIEQAVRKRTSDIHIEPMETRLRIRFRVDGVLQEEMLHDISVHPAMIARIKIISGMDISEKRKPQDGRATSIVDGQEYDIRVSLLPTVYGEKCVMRLTQKKALTRDKRELGFPPAELDKFNKILSHPNGIILVTGPTGSGKSTTLYTALSELNTAGVNIITVEDPVEADVPGTNQVQVNEKAGLTFASALRSILRQDPDIIMIGEIRDQETAEIAVKASITGHLVVSTLHTNSAASTITRLSDMGVEDYMLADSVVGIIAQRLVRRVCPDCSALEPADEFELEVLGKKDSTEPVMIRHPGHKDCLNCGGTGYKGRIGVYEIMPISPTLKRAISKGESAEKLEDIALSEGMKTLRMAAVGYALDGVTTVEEVKRITFEE